MNRPPCHSSGPPGAGTALLLACTLLLTGCVSTKYKMAPKETAKPPVVLDLAATQSPLALKLHTVIVFKGPGSWKQEAYWDEYVVALSNQGAAPVVLESATLVDALGTEQACGTDPWKLEKQSRENLKKYAHYGRKVMIGAGLTVAWVVSPVLGYSAAMAGADVLAGAAVGVFVLVPVWAIGSGVRYFIAENAIEDEFARRRIKLPLELKPGESRLGSLFFPVSPGPQRLVVHGRAGGQAVADTLDLAPLAGLHFLKELTDPAPAAPAKP